MRRLWLLLPTLTVVGLQVGFLIGLEIDPRITIPRLAIFLTVLAFNFFGDGWRDALDPRLKQ